MSVRVRIAPSPTGDPHVGTAYIGLINYCFAKRNGGAFVLRIEDTDQTRCTPESAQAIFDSMKWLGLRYDEGPDVGGPHGPYVQSERVKLGIYRTYADRLVEQGDAYYCFCTPAELEAMKARQRAANQPIMYDRRHRGIELSEAKARAAAGEPYVIRMKAPLEGEFVYKDRLRKQAVAKPWKDIDDQVLLKSDGWPTYHLAAVVDDHLMGITHVIRAEEWLNSLPKHIWLNEHLGFTPPEYVHVGLLRNADKSKISKRKNPVSLNFYRDSGYLPQALLNFLGLMGGGMAQPTEQEIVSQNLNTKEGDIFSLAEMIAKYDFARISLGGPVFDLVKLKWLNGEYIRKLSPEAFVAALRSTVLSDANLAAIGPLVQARINILGEFGDLAGFLLTDNVLPPESVWLPKKRTPEETLKFADEQLTALEASPWHALALEAALKQLGEEKQWSVKENFMLLRAILTGSTTSPPLMESLVVFGKARSLDRIRRFLDVQKKLANQRKA